MSRPTPNLLLPLTRLGAITLMGLLAVSACRTVAPLPQAPIRVILDTDMGSDCDDVGALALLHQYANQGKVDILAVIYSSGAVPYGVGVIDAINRYYGRPDIPIGANYDPTVGDPVDKMQAEKLAKDTAAFGNDVIQTTDVPEQTSLLRTMLSAAADNSVVYITIGHTKGLYDLLVSEPDSISDLSGRALVAQKLARWIALGALQARNGDKHYAKDWNFFFNGTAPYTHYLVDSFPKPVYFVDGGGDILTGASLLTTPSGNIVRTAYRDWLWQVEQKTLADQRPSWDLLAVYYAVEESETHFSVYDRGYLEFDVRQGCRWITTDAATRHHYVQARTGYASDLAAYFNNLIRR